MRGQYAWASLLLAGLVAFVIWNPLQPPAEVEGVRTLRQAEFVMSDSPAPESQGWQTVKLPDSWRERTPDASGLAWYRLRFSLAVVPTELQALYLPRLSVAGELWLNGALLTAPVISGEAVGSSAKSQLLRQASDAPLYLTLPSSAFRMGENELLVRMQGDKDVRSGLAAVRSGPATLLEPIWRQQYLLYVVLPYVLMILLGVAICLAYAYAHRRRQYRVIMICLAVGIFALVLDLAKSMPLSLGDRHALRAGVFAVLSWLLCRACIAISTPPRWTGPVLDGVLVFVLVAIASQLIMRTSSDRVWGFLLPFFPVIALLIAALLDSARQQRSVRLLLLALAVLIWSATILQSLLLPLGWLAWESFRYSAAGAIPMAIMLLLFFGERFVADREEAIRHQRVAVSDERARILQDMHDGMGAQLITAKRLALRPEIDRLELAHMIDESLQDLRLIIDSLDIREGDLLPLLGNLRFRFEPRLSALGIRLSWEVQPVPMLDKLTPAGALAILRTVQESLNNALRHAQPTQIRLVIMPQGEDALVEVIDDGIGFVSEQASPGRGLQAIRTRARRLGIVLSIDSRPGEGTRVSLRIPASLTA